MFGTGHPQPPQGQVMCGTFERNWNEVKVGRRYERGYLLMFFRDGISIPFRWLDKRQHEQLRVLITAHAWPGVA